MAENTFTFVVSDESVNKYGYRVLSSGIDMTEFKKNPVMFWNHQRSGDDLFSSRDRLPVGKWENIRIDDQNRVLADAVIDMNDNLGKKLIQKVSDGFINASSIGIGVQEVSADELLMIEGQTRPTVTKSTLQEISIVDIPANSNAMKLSFLSVGGQTLNLNSSEDVEKLNTLLPMIEDKTEKTVETLNATQEATKEATENVIETTEERIETTEETSQEDSKEIVNESEDELTEDVESTDQSVSDSILSSKLKTTLSAFFDTLSANFTLNKKKGSDKSIKLSDLFSTLKSDLDKSMTDIVDKSEQTKPDADEDIEELRSSFEIMKTEISFLNDKIKSANDTLKSAEEKINTLKNENIKLKSADLVDKKESDNSVLSHKESQEVKELTELEKQLSAFGNFGKSYINKKA